MFHCSKRNCQYIIYNSTMDNKKTFDKLPVEVISHIFVFLQLPDRKNASTVCWSWYEASIHPMFLNNEVICLKDMDNCGIEKVLKIYARSLRPIFIFKICGLGISFQDSDDSDPELLVNDFHWVKTVWPLLGAKVLSLEFFDTVEFVDGILPAILNETRQLKILKIHNLQFSHNEELYKVKRLQSLQELALYNFEPDNIDKNKLLGVIPKHLRKICLKTMWGSNTIIEDITKMLSYCSFYLETLELINVDVTRDLMQSITNLNMKLKKFCLVLADSMYYNHEPETLWPLFKTQWPLIDLTLHASCLTDEHLYHITDAFKNLEYLSISSDHVLCNVTEDGIDSFDSLKKLKTLHVGFGENYRALGKFY